jgi:hypothetical protein
MEYILARVSALGESVDCLERSFEVDDMVSSDGEKFSTTKPSVKVKLFAVGAYF